MGLFGAQLFDANIHQQTEPEGLEEKEDEAFFSVEEPQTQKIAVEEKKKRAQVQGQPVPDFLEPQRALIGIPKKGISNQVIGRFLPSLQLLDGLFGGEAVVLFDKE